MRVAQATTRSPRRSWPQPTAEGEACTRALRTVWRAIEAGDGRLALEYLSRRWPTEFGARWLEVIGADRGAVRIEQVSARATLEAKLNRLAERRRATRQIESRGVTGPGTRPQPG